MNAYSVIRSLRITVFALFILCCVVTLIAWGLDRHSNLDNYWDRNDYNFIINFAQLGCCAVAALFGFVFIGCVIETHGKVSKGDIEGTEDNALFGTICALLALLAIGLIFAFQYLRHHPQYADDFWSVAIRTLAILLILLFLASIFTLITGRGAARAVNVTQPVEKEEDVDDNLEEEDGEDLSDLPEVPAMRYRTI